MKTYKNLWDEFISKENFEKAYKNAKKGKNYQRSVREFGEDWETKLEALRQSVILGTFHTSKYTSKVIYEPKKRTIYKLPFNPDRIVQHAIMNVLKPILYRKFIQNSYACIEGRGQIKASLKCSEYVRKNDYCLKCDIKKFYPSINQHKLSDSFHRFIKDEKFMAIIDDVIFSFDGGYNCPIGNYCSQWFGNFYLTKLDNFVLHILKPSGYERYCDDFMLFSKSKEFLHDCRKRIERFLREKLELKFSRADVFNVKQGVDFCGYRHFGKYVLIRKKTAQRLIKRFKKIEIEINSKEYDRDFLKAQIASANGLMVHACSGNLRKSIKYDELVALLG